VNVQEIIQSGVLELYAAGLATPAEKQQVEAWRLQYAEVAAELNAIELSLEKYAQVNAVVPAASVKEKLLNKINSQSEVTVANTSGAAQPAKVVSFNGWKWAAAASIALLVGSTIFNYSLYNKTQNTVAKLNEAQQQLANVKQEADEMRNDMGVVQNPFSKPVSLNGMPEMPDAKAKIFWLTNTGDVMVDASNLPDAPAGEQYQFWAIVDGKPVDGGLIITNDKGKKIRMQKMKSFGRAEAFAISLEKEGGNPTPTKVVSMGKL
jgi:anti-sigma-K factor RskA